MMLRSVSYSHALLGAIDEITRFRSKVDTTILAVLVDVNDVI